MTQPELYKVLFSKLDIEKIKKAVTNPFNLRFDKELVSYYKPQRIAEKWSKIFLSKNQKLHLSAWIDAHSKDKEFLRDFLSDKYYKATIVLTITKIN